MTEKLNDILQEMKTCIDCLRLKNDSFAGICQDHLDQQMEDYHNEK